MANFPGPGSIILRGRGKSRIDPGSEDVFIQETEGQRGYIQLFSTDHG